MDSELDRADEPTIVRWSDVLDGAGADPRVPTASRAMRDLTAIFFESSERKDFDGPDERTAFFKLWLGQYLKHEPDLAFLACEGEGRVIGYIVGWVASPIGDPRFGSLIYYETFQDAVWRYPAHLHINVASDVRSFGLGAKLVSTLCHELRARGVPGVHLVTGEASRNVGFYRRNGFELIATHRSGERARVLLGRAL